MGRNRIAEGLGLLRVAWVALLAVVALLATGICANRLLTRSSNEPVSIDGFATLFGLNLVLAVPPTLLMIASLFGAHREEKEEKATRVGFAAELLQDVSRLFLVVHWLLVAALQTVRSRLLKHHGPQADAVSRPLEAVNMLLRAWSGVLVRGLSVTSHLAWCLALGVVLASFFASTVFRQYDFRWQSTWLDEQSKLAALRAVCAPIAGLPLAPAPDEDADLVRYLSEEPLPAESRPALRAATARLLFAVLLYYGLLPRCVLAAIAGVQVARSVRALRPRLDEPYVRAILDRLRRPPMGSSDGDGETEDEASAVAAGENGPAQPAELAASSLVGSRTARSASPATVAEHPAEAQLAVLGFEVALAEEAWPATFALRASDRPWVLGNAGDRASRRAIVERLALSSAQVGRVLLVANLREAPDDLFVRFLADVVGALSPAAADGIVLVLTGGTALREKFGGDADRVEARVRLWRQRAASCGVSADHVVEFDHENATAEARRVLRDRLDSLWGLRPADEALTHRGLFFAGRFAEAAAMILQAVSQVAPAASPEDVQRQAQSLHQHIGALYARERGLLTRTLANAGPDLERLHESLADAGRRAGQRVAECVRDGLSAWTNAAARLRTYLGGLSGRWAAAGGIAAALGLTGLGLTPALVGGAVASLFGLHAPMLLGRLGWGHTHAAEPGKDVAKTQALDDLVRANLVWALVLELQGNPEETIARTLSRLLADLDAPLASIDDARRLLDIVAGRLEALGENATDT
ncbi:MAG: DUF2868 domain-containing protein [Thermoguttaceae bacterium]|nr:DUF2868 domain-containing protein [Thermoguttaceae bacterium]